MKTTNVGAGGNQKRKLRLMPLLALLMGLALPVYVYAGSEAECQACLAGCYSELAQAQYICATTYSCSGLPYWEQQWCYYYQQQCYNEAGNNVQPCFNACSAGPCSG